MQTIAILLTVFNRKQKTIDCLDTIADAFSKQLIPFSIYVFLTDDGSTDGTSEAINEKHYSFPIHISYGDGQTHI